MNVPISRLLLLLSLATYAACLPMVAFCLDGSGCFAAWNVLIYGWMALTIHSTHLIWLANPLLLAAWVLIATSRPGGSTRYKVATLAVSGLALIVAVSFLQPVGIVSSEGGVAVEVASRAAGYWLWLASMLAAFLAAMLLPMQAPAEVEEEAQLG